MAYWDASALVPLCVNQPASRAFRRLLAEDRRIVVWWGTPIEIRSALARLKQEKAISSEGMVQGLDRLAVLRRSWAEVLPTDRLRDFAETLPDRFGLRTLDAFQLAAAFLWCNERPRRRAFVCLDRRLAASAAELGFSTMGL